MPTGPRGPESAPVERDRVYTVLGSVSRAGDWLPPEQVDAIAGLGSVVLDFREAVLPPGVTEVKATAILGQVDIIVPKEIEVDLSGFSVLGRLEHRVRTPPIHERLFAWWQQRRAGPVNEEAKSTARKPSPSPDGAADSAGPEEETVISIRGLAILGSVSIQRV